jgi:hypothetical protein
VCSLCLGNLRDELNQFLGLPFLFHPRLLDVSAAERSFFKLCPDDEQTSRYGRGTTLTIDRCLGGHQENGTKLCLHCCSRVVGGGKRYLGCRQRIRSAVNDRIGIEPNP